MPFYPANGQAKLFGGRALFSMYNRKAMEENRPEDWLENLPLQTENIAFKPDEMLLCIKCQRSNPPNRLKCFYCGGELEITEAQSRFLKPNLRKLENWEKGFNVIFLSVSEAFDESQASEIARLLKFENAVLRSLFVSKTPLPVARAESEKEAEVVRSRLRESGVETLILSDEKLAIEKPPKRLRGIESRGDELILKLFSDEESVELAPEDLILIVTGAVFERKIAATETYSKKGENKILDSSEIASDETLIDLYSRRDASGFRIFARGFDFSFLGAEKGLLAKDNIKKVAGKLRQIAPHARSVEDYSQNRNFLAAVWEVEQRTDSKGLKREGVGKFNLESVTTVNNLSQFTRYSRLQRHLL